MPSPAVCVAIPAYNEAPRLPQFLERLGVELAAVKNAAVELIVVDDGSRPDELIAHQRAVARLAAEFAQSRSEHSTRLIESPRNQGKASAIRLGWEQANPSAAWLGFLDADGAVPAHEVARLLGSLATADFDALAGSRIRMAGRSIVRSEFRHLQGRVFATLTELTLKLGLYDPQCGFKLVRGELLRPLLGRLQERTWMLDLEVLALVARAGGRIKEEPIDWAETGDSKVRFAVDAAKMARDLVSMRRRLDRG